MTSHSPTSPRLTPSRAGAQILQAHLGTGGDIFYLSPRSPVGSVPIRGGVPVLFPQFADRGPLPKHGLARTALWALVQESKSDEAHSAVFELALAPRPLGVWPHAAHLILQAEASLHGLRLCLQITNTGSSAFSWTGGLHPYFAVDDVQTCSLTGLAGLRVQDRYAPCLSTEPGGAPNWNGQPVERLYGACPPLTLFTGSRALAITANGFEQWMVWNPGHDGGDALPDLPTGDWRRFVCIEPVCVSHPVSLLPGQVFTGTLDIRVLPYAPTSGESA